PIGPVAPAWPIGPLAPTWPVGPVAPAGPGGPAGPGNPVGPWGPEGPVGPAGPWGPGPCFSRASTRCRSALISPGAPPGSAWTEGGTAHVRNKASNVA